MGKDLSFLGFKNDIAKHPHSAKDQRRDPGGGWSELAFARHNGFESAANTWCRFRATTRCHLVAMLTVLMTHLLHKLGRNLALAAPARSFPKDFA